MKRVDVSMKGAIRDQLREIAFPETTSLKPPKEKVAPKGGKKKKVAKGTSRVTRSKNQSTSREPSGWEHVDKQYPGTQASQKKPSSSKSKAKVSEPSPTRIIPRIREMPKFMHPYIDDIVDVVGDGWCGYRCMALEYNGHEDNFELIKFHMLKELNLHKETYMKVYATEKRFNYIRDALYPPKRKILPGHVAPMDKWLTFPDMGHILATHYNKVVVELTKPGERISGTFFPLRGKPPSNPDKNLVCLGLVPGHFFLVKLKEGCPLPPTCLEWKNHRSEEAAEWEYPFMDRQSTYVDLVAQHMKGKPKKILTGVGSSKDEPYIY
jgi:histone-lysine N-methyltransferase SETD2